MPNFWAVKIYYRNYVAGICRSYHKSSDCFEYPKKSLLKSSYQNKKILAKIFQPKNMGVSWCCGNYCWLAFVLLCGYCSVSFQSFVLRHWCPQHQETTKNILKLKISHPKKSFGHPCHLKFAVPPLGVGLLFGTWNPFSLFYFLSTAKSIEPACKCLSMVSLYWMIDVIHPIHNFFFRYWAMLIPIINIEPLAGIFCRSHSTGQNTGHHATSNFFKARPAASPSPNPYPKCYF